jgi:DNA-directed RNA polymerase subunit beta'
LTLAQDGLKGDGKVFNSIDDVLLALDAKAVATQTKIKIRWKGDLIDLEKEHSPQDVMRASIRKDVDTLISTTVGRVIFNERLTRDGLPFVNGTLKKKRSSISGNVLSS